MEVTIGRAPIFIHADGREELLVKHKAFIDCRKKRKIFVAHRRGRKTSISLEEVFKYLAANPGIVGKTLAPLRKQAKEIIWDDPDMLFKIVPPEIIKEINRSDLRITLKNGSIWTLDGVDDPNFQRGGNCRVLHLTEAGDHQEQTWTTIYEPVLRANNGIAIFEGNPRGQNWFYDLYNRAETREGWARFLIKATETPIFTSTDLADISANIPENVFLAEYMCEWVGSTGTVFRNIERQTVLAPKEPEPGRKYRIGIDLAKRQDFTVASVVDRHTWDQVAIDRYNQLDWNLIKDRLKETILKFGRRSNQNEVDVLVEVNGVGDPIYDDLWRWVASEKDLNCTLRAFTTNVNAKNMLVQNMCMILDGSHAELLDNPIMKQEFRAFTYIKTRDHYIYGAIEPNHDDTVMATMLAYWDLGGKLPEPEGKPRYSALAEAMGHGQSSADFTDYLISP